MCKYLVTQTFPELVRDWLAAGGKGLDGEDGGLQQQVQDLSHLEGQGNELFTVRAWIIKKISKKHSARFYEKLRFVKSSESELFLKLKTIIFTNFCIDLTFFGTLK